MATGDKSIHVRLTEPERERLEWEAEQAGRSLSDYVRRRLFPEDARGIAVDAIQKAAAGELKHTIKSQVTETQAKAITERCAEAGISVSEYVRRALAQEPVIVILEGKEILRQLSKLGNNINQLTMLAHQGKITAVDLDEVLRVQKKILQELTKIQKRR